MVAQVLDEFFEGVGEYLFGRPAMQAVEQLIETMILEPTGEVGEWLFGIVVVASATVIVAVPIVLLILFSIVFRRRGGEDLAGDPYRQAAGGLLAPLLLLPVLQFLAYPRVSIFSGFDAFEQPLSPAGRAAAGALFLVWFCAFWPRRQWFSRAAWMSLIVIGGSAATALIAIPGVFRAIWDLGRAGLQLDDPAVHAFFFDKNLTPEAVFEVYTTRKLLTGLHWLHAAGGQLTILLALAFPPLAAFRATAGRPDRWPWMYAVWSCVTVVVTIPLWAALLTHVGYVGQSPEAAMAPADVFLKNVFLCWLKKGLPLQAILLAGLFVAAKTTGESMCGLSDEDTRGRERVKRPWWKRLPRAAVERVLAPLTAVALIVAALLGMARAYSANTVFSQYPPRGKAAKPGQTAAAPIVVAQFSSRSGPDRHDYSRGFNTTDYPVYFYIQSFVLPNEPACERFLREADQPHIRPDLETYEKIAAADLLGLKGLSQSELSWSVPRRFLSTMLLVNIRACVSMAQGRWADAFEDIRQQVRVGQLLASEGDLGDLAHLHWLRDYGANSAYVALHHCPAERLPEFLDVLRAAERTVQPIFTTESLVAIEPGLQWPARFFHVAAWARWFSPYLGRQSLLQSFLLLERCEMAEMRLLLLACAARAFAAEKGRPAASMDDLLPYLGGALPIDPFSGEPLIAEFSGDGVCLRTRNNVLPQWLDLRRTTLGDFSSRSLMIRIDAAGRLPVQ